MHKDHGTCRTEGADADTDNLCSSSSFSSANNSHKEQIVLEWRHTGIQEEYCGNFGLKPHQSTIPLFQLGCGLCPH